MSLIKFFASEKDAEEFGAAMDIAAGLPISGRPITKGIHVNPELAQTTRIAKAEFIEDDAGEKRWAYQGCLEQKEGQRVNVHGKVIEISLSGAVSAKAIEKSKDSLRDATDFAKEKVGKK